jgi:hypothetical protein
MHHPARPATVAAALLLAACSVLPGLSEGPRTNDPRVDAPEAGPPVRRDLKYVVVDVNANELRFMDGREAIWTGPVGTGTGLRLAGGGSEWEFSTPNGVFYVQYKELNPVWILPDWYYVREDKPIPPPDSPSRRVPGALGAAAVYITDEIAIHGTDKPELLGQPVSAGCIRMTNEDARRLYHEVEVGTPVLIY